MSDIRGDWKGPWKCELCGDIEFEYKVPHLHVKAVWAAQDGPYSDGIVEKCYGKLVPYDRREV